MIPILYKRGRSSFSNNGLGGLPHWLEPPLVTRELNGEYTFSGIYSVAGLHFDLLACEMIMLIQPAPGITPQPFRIARLLSREDGTCEVEGEHVLYEVKSAVRRPGFNAATNSGQTAMERLITNTLPSLSVITVDSDITLGTTPSFTATKEPENVWDLLTNDKDGILALFGGELDMDHWTIRLMKRIGKDTGITLRWGKDLVAVSAETDARELVTAILPYYCKTEKDSSTGTETTTYLAGSVSYAEDYDAYGYVRAEAVNFTNEFDDQNPVTQAKLTALGAAEIDGRNDSQLMTSIELDTIPQALKSARLGDTLTVEYPQLMLRSSAEIVKTVYDPISEKYVNVSIGTVRRNAADTIARMMKRI